MQEPSFPKRNSRSVEDDGYQLSRLTQRENRPDLAPCGEYSKLVFELVDDCLPLFEPDSLHRFIPIRDCFEFSPKGKSLNFTPIFEDPCLQIRPCLAVQQLIAMLKLHQHDRLEQFLAAPEQLVEGADAEAGFLAYDGKIRRNDSLRTEASDRGLAKAASLPIHVFRTASRHDLPVPLPHLTSG